MDDVSPGESGQTAQARAQSAGDTRTFRLMLSAGDTDKDRNELVLGDQVIIIELTTHNCMVVENLDDCYYLY